MLNESEIKVTEQKAEPMATAAPSAVRILPSLALGDNGSAVRLLQRILIANCYLGNGDFTSVFNNNTRQAVRNFQAANGLTVDGVVGPQTWLILTNYVYGPCLPF